MAFLGVQLRDFLSKRARRTFVIDPDVSEAIDKLAGGHPMEINILVNQALRRFVEFGRYVDSFKLVVSDPRLMKSLWSHVTADEAREMGSRNGNDTLVEFIIYYFRKFDLDSILKTFRVFGAEYTNAFHFSEFGEDHNRMVILRHTLGLPASAYYGASLKSLCDRLGFEVRVDESDDQVACKIYNADAAMKVTPSTFKEQLSKRLVTKTIES